MNNIMIEEQEHLDLTQKNIDREEEHYKKELQEIPRRYTNVLQGDAFLVESLMSATATKLLKLQLAEDSPYFGRIDFLSNDDNNLTKVYVGKTNISDELNNIITTDWRAPICSLYYDSDVGNASYIAPKGTVEGSLELKRSIIIKNGKLISAIDTNSVSNDELLLPYLSDNTSNKMKDIIASIQKEQNMIIRKPINQNLIIQGVAGSGKTSVALHRIAYLAYTLGDNIKDNPFLVIGPNDFFLDYISSLLPELETDPVDQTTIDKLVFDTIKSKLKQEKREIIFEKSNYNSIINNFKSSLDFKKALDLFLEDYMDKYMINDDFIIEGKIVLSSKIIKEQLISDIKEGFNKDKTMNYFVYNFKNNIENFYQMLNKEYRDIYINLPLNNPIRKEYVRKSIELSKALKENGVKLLKNYFKNIKITPVEIYKTFIMHIDKYVNDLDNKTLLQLQNDTLTNIKKKNISFSDIPALLHISSIIDGCNKKYRHIVIDEAQDFGLFFFDALKEHFKNCYFSIYGDLAQSIYPNESIGDWKEVVQKVFNYDCEIINLSKSYRTTIEITQNANKILDQISLAQAQPVIRHGTIPLFSQNAKSVDYLLNKIYELLDKNYETIAIICKTSKEALDTYNSLKDEGIDMELITSDNKEYKGKLFVTTAALSKGLEFDSVIIKDASNNIYSINNKQDMHLLYVACTRALHELIILYDKKLCEVFGNEEELNIEKNNYLALKR